jgi:ABC-type sugar transport system ATPase subunit
VALGRAIIREPVAFLMDEPLSNLDALLRVQMRTELLKLHRRVGRTTVYVTHDQVEAMTMADRIVVMRDGRIQQVGRPAHVYAHPANAFVATFVGSPPMNLFEGRLTTAADGLRFVGDLTVPLDRVPGDAALPLGEPVTLGIRPEHVELVPGSGVTGTVELVEAVGADTYLSIVLRPERTAIVRVPADRVVSEGARIGLRFPTPHVRLFDGRGDRLGWPGPTAVE